MKLNKIFLASVFLLAILSFAPLCASDENMTNDLSVSENQIAKSVPDDVAIAEDEKVDMDYDINYTYKINVGSDKYIDIGLPSDCNGKLEFGINDNETSVLNLVDGKTRYSLKDLNVGDYKLNFKYSNDTKYNDWDTCLWLLVCKPLAFDIKVADEIYTDIPTKLTISTPEGFENGLIKLNHDGPWGYIYDAELENGSTTIETTFENAGNTTVFLMYWSDDDNLNIYGGEDNFTVSAIAKPKIEAKALTLYSSQSKNYKIRLLDGNGKAIAGEKVTFYIDGEKLTTKTTDKKGYATVKIKTMSPDIYKIKTKYKAISVTKTLKVKNVIKPLKSMRGKNVNQIVFTINTNKVDGKYLKGKTLTAKFNAKTYKAKINAKGVAKITIKKNDLSKCKVKTSYNFEVKLGKSIQTQLVEFTQIKPKISYATGNYAKFYGKV